MALRRKIRVLTAKAVCGAVARTPERPAAKRQEREKWLAAQEGGDEICVGQAVPAEPWPERAVAAALGLAASAPPVRERRTGTGRCCADSP